MTRQPIALFAKLACPFVQRTRIVLALKGVDRELRIVDLDNKPEWVEKLYR